MHGLAVQSIGPTEVVQDPKTKMISGRRIGGYDPEVE